MPKQIESVKELKEVIPKVTKKVCRVKRDGSEFKFKINYNSGIYTFVVCDVRKAKSTRKLFPKEWKLVDVPFKKSKAKKN